MRRPSPGRMLGAIGERLRGLRPSLGWLRRFFGGLADRLRGLRYLLADLLYVLARFPRAVARGAATFWAALPAATRSRLLAALGAVVVAILALGVVVPNLPCALPGGDECPPDDDAIELVPADALVYVHANLDDDTEQASNAAAIVNRTPLVSRQVIGQLLPLLVGAAGAPSDFGREIEPWFGGEVAVTIVGSGGDAEQVQMLEVSDRRGALAYAESIAAGVPEKSSYRGVEISEDDRNLATVLVEDFLLLGTSRGVRDIVDVATDAEGADPLSDDEVAEQALEELPDHRVAEAYLSRDGIRDYVAPREAQLSVLEPLVDSAASRGAALSLSADEGGFSLASRSLLDAERSEAEPGFFAAFDEFSPELPEELASDTLAYLGLGQAQETIEALSRQATVRAPGIAAGLTDLIRRLRGGAGVDLQRDLVPAIGGEAAFAVVPRPGAKEREAKGLPGSEPPETLSPGTLTPYIAFLADDVDEKRARDALARLQGPMARAFDPDLGAPVFDQQRFGDVEAQVLRLSPVAQLVYATHDSRLVIANDKAAAQRLDEGGDALAGSDLYVEVTDGLPDDPALVAYLDLAGLLAFAELSGLAEDTAYGAFAPDLRRLRAFALAVAGDRELLTADAQVLID